MLPEEVTIEIETTRIMDGDTSCDYVKAHGKSYLKNEKIYISYSEKMEGLTYEVPSLLTIDDSYMKISRRGEVRSSMTFFPKQETTCQYATSVGTIELVTHTNRYAAIIEEERIVIHLEYSVKMNGVDSGSSKVLITIS